MRTQNFFSYFSTKTYVVGTQKNRLNETVLLSTQNTCLTLWVRKYSQFYAKIFVYLNLSIHYAIEKQCHSGSLSHLIQSYAIIKRVQPLYKILDCLQSLKQFFINAMKNCFMDWSQSNNKYVLSSLIRMSMVVIVCNRKS